MPGPPRGAGQGVWPLHRPEVARSHGPEGHIPRLPGPERRGEIHDDQDYDDPDPAFPRPGCPARHRCPSGPDAAPGTEWRGDRDAGILWISLAARDSRVRGSPPRHVVRGERTPQRGRPEGGQADRLGRPPDSGVLEGHEATPRDRASAPPRARNPHPGRTHVGIGPAGHGRGPRRDQVAQGRRPDDLHELPPPRRGPRSVRRRRAPEPWGAPDPRLRAGSLEGRGHVDVPDDLPPLPDTARPRSPRIPPGDRRGQGRRRLDGRLADLRRGGGTGEGPGGDGLARAEGPHVSPARLVPRTALPRPHPGVGSPMTASAFGQVVTVASYEIRKYIRGRRLLGVLILVGLIVGLFLGLPPALGTPYASNPNAFVSTFATFTGLLVVLSGVLFAADALVSEHEQRTGYFLFPNPVRREVLVLGKIAASLIVSAAVISLYYGGAALAAPVITHSLTWDVGLSYVYALASMLSVVGVAYLVSATFKSTVAATVLTFFLFTLIFSIVGAILPAAKIDPWFIPTSASGIITNVLGRAEVRPGPGGGASVGFVPDPATSLLVFLAYAIVGGVLAIVWFRRRELSS